MMYLVVSDRHIVMDWTLKKNEAEKIKSNLELRFATLFSGKCGKMYKARFYVVEESAYYDADEERRVNIAYEGSLG